MIGRNETLNNPFIFGEDLLELIKQRESFRVGIRTLLASPLTSNAFRIVLHNEMKQIEENITMRQIAAEQKYLTATKLASS